MRERAVDGRRAGAARTAAALKLTLVAATGGVGRQLLAQALTAGHSLTAVVRNPAALADAGVRTVPLDLGAADPAALVEAIRGADAVLSALGRRRAADQGIAARGTRALVQAMEAAGTRRIVVVSASPVSTTPSPARPYPPAHDPGEGWLQRHLLTPVIRAVLAPVYADLAEMEDVLNASSLEWTVVRPPRLTDGKLTGRYRTAVDHNVRGGLFISRADLAHLMLRVLGDPSTVRRAIGVGY